MPIDKGAQPTGRRLIEEWLPIAALGVESVRERTPMTPFPAPNRLHVWWARRPLVACRAAILASLLPADADRDMFLHVLGIHGDPVASRRRIDLARRKGERFEGQAYSYSRAFSYVPSSDDLAWLSECTGRNDLASVTLLDPTAGGGSIPFEAVRLRLSTQANDLNSVAGLILRATVEFPSRYGMALVDEFKRLAGKFIALREERLAPYFPKEPEPSSIPTNFLWARTITCPYCEGLVPLSPNWRLAPNGTGVRLVPNLGEGPGSTGRRCGFEIVRHAREQSAGTVAGGDATCPYSDCGRVIDGDEVKRQAQAGDMGEQLYAVVFKRKVETRTKTGKKRIKWMRGYRAPRPEDGNMEAVLARLAEKLPEWEALDLVPSEEFPEGTNDDRPLQYGMPLWRDMFSPRQLLCHGASVEIFRELWDNERAAGGLTDARRAAYVYLALSLDKLRDYDSRMSVWHSLRESITNTFSQHDYSFKWSYVEMSFLVAGVGYDWAIKQVAKCIEELVELVRPDAANGGNGTLLDRSTFTPPPVTISCKSADALDHLGDASVDLVVMDPPYGANVMYAELSDFFYVWLKRTAGHVVPELFRSRLTDKEHEAVANVARFKGKKGAKVLALRDYQERMAPIFTECRRVLKADGLMTVMFTHKDTGAWDALTRGLIEAGFVITASWPINTEAEGSLHIKDKAAANSTIFLVCRPRAEAQADAETTYWEDVEPEVAQAVRTRVAEFQAAGIGGVDLYLASFGPALEAFSRHWPLRRGTPRPQPEVRRRRRQKELFEEAWDPYAATPEDALDAARREVKRWRLEQLTHLKADADLDPPTAFFVLAWDAFRAPVFDYDEALRLARAVGVDLDGQVVGRLAEKKGSNIRLWDSAMRAAKGALGPVDGSRGMIDSIHHAAHAARTRSLAAARELLANASVDKEPRFFASLEAVLEVLPPAKVYSGVEPSGETAGAATDFEALEGLRRLAYTEQVDPPKQLEMFKEEAPA